MSDENDQNLTRRMAGSYSEAAALQADIAAKWHDVSAAMQSLIPERAIEENSETVGRLDVLIRCLEDDRHRDPDRPKPSGGDALQFHLSRLWVRSLYEICRHLSVIDQRPYARRIRFLFGELEAVRMPGAVSSETVLHKQINAPIAHAASTRDGGAASLPYRAPDGLSDRGSVIWYDTGGKGRPPKWIERRALSDRTLVLFD